MRIYRSLTAAVAFPLIIGFIGLTQLMQRPRFASYHTVDVVQLLASGMCFGVALAALLVMLRGKRDGLAAVQCFQYRNIVFQLLECATERLPDQGVIVDHENFHKFQ